MNNLPPINAVQTRVIQCGSQFRAIFSTDGLNWMPIEATSRNIQDDAEAVAARFKTATETILPAGAVVWRSQ